MLNFRLSGRLSRAALEHFRTVVLAVVVVAVGVVVPWLWGGAPSSVAEAADSARVPVERPAFRTATSRTVENSDGSFTTSLFEQPVNFRAADGSWRPISDRLVDASGKAARDGYEVENEANSFKVAFRSSADAAGLVRFEAFGEAWEFGLDGAEAKQAQVAENRVGYHGVFPGALLRYEVIGDGLKESVVLSDSSAPSLYTFTLVPPKGASVRAVASKSGGFELYEEGSPVPVLVLAAPTVADSGGIAGADASKSPGAPTPPTVDSGAARFADGKASMTVAKRDDGSFAVKVAIDEKWLASPERVFPVVIDPSVSIPQPTIDGTFDQNVPASLPDMGSTTLSVGKDTTGSLYRAGLKFDLGSIPTGALVSGASLNLYFLYCFPTVSYPSNNCTYVWPYYDTSLSVHQFGGNWDGTTTAGATVVQNAAASTALSTTSFHVGWDGDQPQIWKSWGVTSAVQAWMANTSSNFGLLVRQASEGASCGSSVCGLRFASSEWADTSFRPRLDVTWSGDGVTLPQPLTLHANGAELAWDQNPAPTGTFQRYEIHRLQTAGFTPSASTLIASIGDRSVTSFTDTTAAPGTAFSYKIVVVSKVSGTDTPFPSNEIRVTLPADLTTTKTVVTTKADYSITGSDRDCSNHGAHTYITIDGAPDQGQNVERSFFQFDLRDIPSSATVSSAKVSLFTFGSSSTAVQLRRVTSEWTEGNVPNSGSTHICNGSGMSWNERQPNVKWTSAGGDFDTSTVAATVTTGAGAHWDVFDSASNANLVPIVQGWLSGTNANLGLVLKLPTEAYAGSIGGLWMSDDYTVTPTLRPKLDLTYTDGSHALAPQVAVGYPAPSQQLAGSVNVTAGASDDGRVTGVQFKLDGSNLGAAQTTAPYSVSWNTTSASRGTHTVSAVATDDAGNTTTSPAVSVTVANSTPPATSVTSAAAAGALNSPPTATASATPASGTAPLTVAFTGNGSDADGTIAAYSWDLNGDGTYGDSTAQNPSNPYSSNGIYYARLRITDNQGAFGFSPPVTITVASPPTAPSVVGFTKASANNPTSGSWALPTGWAAGDLLVVYWYTRDGAKTFTEGATITETIDSNNSSNGRLFVGYRRLVAGDTNPTWTSSSSTNNTSVWGAIILRGARATGNPFEATSGLPTTFTNVQSPNPSAVTTITANSAVLTLFGKNNDSGTSTVPSGYTAQGFQDETGGTDASAGAATRNVASPSSEDPSVWTLGGTASDDGVTWTAAIAPAAANLYPTASASASPSAGAAPLTVNFTGSGSDPDGGSISAYSWDLNGDGSFGDSTLQNPSNAYATAGTYRAWLRTTDSAGAYGFSAPVTITVGTTSPTWDLAASASDDNAVSKVDFLVDGNRVGSANSSPWGTSVNTLTARPQIYDGSHSVTTIAYDADGNTTTSASFPITVNNNGGGKYRATIATNGVLANTTGVIPTEMRYDPTAGSQDGAPLTVNIANSSGVSWAAASVKLRYRWLNPDGTEFSNSGDISIGSDLAAGANRNVAVTVLPPVLPTAVMRGRLTLRIDLYDTAASAYFAAKGNQPLEQTVTVTRVQTDELGLERYQQYDGENLGGGVDDSINLANGNNVVQWQPFAQPGRGLNTTVTMTYNSLEVGSVSPLGNGWSLAVSSLTPFGLPLDIHPNAADNAPAVPRTTKWVGLTDADGSYHRFVGNAAGTYYTPPAGVNLYLKYVSGATADKRWQVVKPDRTMFFYDAQGYPTRVEDQDGNALVMALQDPIPAGEDAYGLAKRVTSVTDAGGRAFTFAYYSKAETAAPALRGKLKSITDHVGHKVRFDYYDDGNLMRITEEGGTNADGSYLPDRTLIANYVNTAGTGAAIGTLAARKTPDPTTVQGTKLFSLIDFRGNETTFAYHPSGSKDGRVQTRTNRTGDQTGYDYNTTTQTATVSMPLARTWVYSFDSQGRVTGIDDPVNPADTTVLWATNGTNTVNKVTEPNGQFTTYTYNENGYLLTKTDQLGNQTTVSYESFVVDGNDASGNWEPGRDEGHISRVKSLTKPVGNATPTPTTDYKWSFGYVDNAEDHVQTVTDPLGNATTNTWNGDGTLQSTTLPTNNDSIARTTTYNSYGLNGVPTQVTDPAGGITRASYYANGNLATQQDPNHSSYSGGTDATYQQQYFYDSYGRVGRTSQPKSTLLRPGLLIWDDTAYDANNNTTASLNPHYGQGDSGTAPRSTTVYDAMDRQTSTTGPRVTATGDLTKTVTSYDAAGRAATVTAPRGFNTGAVAKDFQTDTAYDNLDRVKSTTSYTVDGSGAEVPALRRVTNSCYDLAGDLRSTTAPRGAAAFTGCPAITTGTYTPYSGNYTTRFGYDGAHRNTTTTNPAGTVTQTAYDENDQPISSTDGNNKVTTYTYNDRGDRISQVEPFDIGGTHPTLTTKWVYDPLGNVQKTVSPRAYDIGGASGPYTDYVTTNSYDALGRLVRTALPSVTGTSYQATVLADSPALYWRLPETTGTTAADTSTNSRPGTYHAGLTLGQSSVLAAEPSDKSISLTGTASASPLDRTTTAGLPSGSSARTVELWFKTTSSSRQALFSMGALGAGQEFTLFADGGNQFFAWGWGSGDRTFTAGSSYNDGNWHHVAEVYDGTNLIVYYDGVSLGSQTVSLNTSSANGFSVGYAIPAGDGNSGKPLTGSIDEVAVYNTALSATNIQARIAARNNTDAQTYTHLGYDANGNQTLVSLPTAQANPALLNDPEKTAVSYWDTGWVATSTDPATPKSRFDYTAEGWQASRAPELTGTAGTIDGTKTMYWDYLPDGLVKTLRDLGGERAIYDYDADGNRTTILDADGLTQPTQTPLNIDATFSGFEELIKVRNPKPGAAGTYMATSFEYDLNGNTSKLIDNAQEGTSPASGRIQAYTYDLADRPATQEDDYGTPAANGDDEQLTFAYDPNSQPTARVLKKGGTGSWAQEQMSGRTYYDNGLLKTLRNCDNSSAGTCDNTTAAAKVLEEHTLSYLNTDGTIYLNGNRTKDVFRRKQADGSATCSTATCTPTWAYDARDRLTQEYDGISKTTDFTLDPAGNAILEATTGTGTISRSFTGQQLTTSSQSGATSRYLYDSNGNNDCIVVGTWATNTCPLAGDTNLLTDYAYDYANRLTASRIYNGGSLTDSADYTNDPLDRPVSQTETHSGATTTTATTYIGVSNAPSSEIITGTGATTKKYAYDALGQRSTISDGSNRYSYLYEPHGSVSLLVDQSNNVKASYGYTAYGGTNPTLTKTTAGFNPSAKLKTNPYEYTGKRYDTGSATLDMGARRYNPTAGRFLQQDVYYNSLDNLGLSQDPLTANRYLFTGANPVNYVELDGHSPTFEGADEKRNEQERAISNCGASGSPDSKAAEWVADYWCEIARNGNPSTADGTTWEIIVGGAIATAGLLPLVAELSGLEAAVVVRALAMRLRISVKEARELLASLKRLGNNVKVQQVVKIGQVLKHLDNSALGKCGQSLGALAFGVNTSRIAAAIRDCGELAVKVKKH